ncbi:MAG: 1-deoxy-D-xylulose-5-phosphate reductoisomerase [Clostridia bacterium]|nr:1-deoxy-D-xylulose-5-phosphate reductoisomerase [Clostridia bacterium]
MQAVAVLGSTGSVGCQTLEVVAAHPGRWQVVGLAAGGNDRLLVQQARRFRPAMVALHDAAAARRAADALAGLGIEVLAGEEGVVAVATMAEAEIVVAAIVGSAGVRPALAALEAGKDLALANKEALVAAGPLFAAACGGFPLCAGDDRPRILPVDSEHSAVFQCLRGERRDDVRRLILTASGGPFRGYTRERLAEVKPAEALRHPTWRMGARITIDSALLANKGLEVIEAHWLFGLPYEKIEVLVHPQSVVHSLVEMVDGSVLAQLAPADMRGPIQYALAFPDRLGATFPSLDLGAVGSLTFEEPDRELFPLLDLAYQAGRAGGTAPAVFNAAKEEAVTAYLDGRVGFLDVARMVCRVLADHRPRDVDGLEAVLAADRWARAQVRDAVEREGRR